MVAQVFFVALGYHLNLLSIGIGNDTLQNKRDDG